jgi:hypothetical protein
LRLGLMDDPGAVRWRRDVSIIDAAVQWEAAAMQRCDAKWQAWMGWGPAVLEDGRRRGRAAAMAEDDMAGQFPGAGEWCRGLPAIGTLRAARRAWAAEVADAPYFFAAAGMLHRVDVCGLGVVDVLAAEAERIAMSAYKDAVAAAHRSILVTSDPPAMNPVRSVQANAVLLWMRALAAGGISADERESVLRELEFDYSDAVVEARQSDWMPE